MQKKSFDTGITHVALFDKLLTLIKPYGPHITYCKEPKHII